MVNSTMIGLFALGGLGLFIAMQKGVFASSGNDVPTLDDLAKQQEIAVGSTVTNVGALGLPEGKSETPNTVKSNIVTSNLFTEQALRDLVNAELRKKETASLNNGLTEVSTTYDRSQDISTAKSLELFRSDTSSLIVHAAFNPIGSANVLGVRGKPISQNALARTQETFSATVTTKTGGTRNILVSEEALSRIQSNLANSANSLS